MEREKNRRAAPRGGGVVFPLAEVGEGGVGGGWRRLFIVRGVPVGLAPLLQGCKGGRPDSASLRRGSRGAGGGGQGASLALNEWAFDHEGVRRRDCGRPFWGEKRLRQAWGGSGGRGPFGNVPCWRRGRAAMLLAGRGGGGGGGGSAPC